MTTAGQFGRGVAGVFSVTLLLVALLSALPSPALAAGAFAGFAGSWRGGGEIEMTDGSRETIRCKASYAVRADGDALNINVACASDSYRVNLLSSVQAQGNDFSGSWQETTRQVQGSVTGRIPVPGEMLASLDAMGGGIQLGARTVGKRQAIAIRSQGSDVQRVDITLRRK